MSGENSSAMWSISTNYKPISSLNFRRTFLAILSPQAISPPGNDQPLFLRLTKTIFPSEVKKIVAVLKLVAGTP